MKKKHLIIIIAAALIIIVMLVLRTIGNTLMMDSISFTEVSLDSFQQQYKTTATVKGHLHSYYYNGIVTECCFTVGDWLEADSVILKYLDGENRECELKSETAGIIRELSGNCVTVEDSDYYLLAKVPLDRFFLINEQTVCLFSSSSSSFRATVTAKSRYRQQDASRNTAAIILQLESSEGLLLNQKGNLTIPLRTVNDVWTVRREALLERNDGYYLLKADWVNRKDHWEKYLIKVKVEMADDQRAVISGIEIENLKVCIIDDLLKELIDD
ncbi:MAG: hypothetical protein E7186_00635 [Erysipelotrichaceae bacterium]|nr:hypothetical protein [Erysipelotrichaceae bacterium]